MAAGRGPEGVGPEHPTRAALGFAVAAAAGEQGHEVSVFLAGDGVQLALDHDRLFVY
ncbi:MAG: DsrE family protein [Gemmatimonadota bacterium]